MPFLPNPSNNITQYTNEYLHAARQDINLLVIGLCHAEHSQGFIEGQFTVLLLVVGDV